MLVRVPLVLGRKFVSHQQRNFEVVTGKVYGQHHQSSTWSVLFLAWLYSHKSTFAAHTITSAQISDYDDVSTLHTFKYQRLFHRSSHI